LNIVPKLIYKINGSVKSCTEENRLKDLKEEPEDIPIATSDPPDKPFVGSAFFRQKPYLQDGEEVLNKITGSINTRNGAFDWVFG
jgi:hypothetical protein